ncbi:MAG: hypothetical protein PF795_12020, partial [Kiritimatiellae bacterium]|nr:hypothetical protein [Kiritimatiellia bacterium]
EPEDEFELDHITLSTAEPPDLDFSGDGMTNADKRALGHDPWLTDNSGDGLPDVWKIAHGFDPLATHDPALDLDGDGLTLAEEAALGLSPYQSDDRVPGFVLMERWNSLGGGTVPHLTNASAFSLSPTQRELMTRLATLENQGNSYGRRIRGYLVPAETRSHTVYQATDGGGEFWKSPKDSPFDRKRTAYVEGYTGINQFNKYAGQTAETVLLQAGEHYYFEVLQKEGSGGDHVHVAWTTPGNSVLHTVETENLVYFSPREDDPIGDGLPATWKTAHGLDPNFRHGIHGAYGDFDGDGLSNLEEYQLGTHPGLWDTDGDGVSDRDEIHLFLSNPLVADIDSTPAYSETFDGSVTVTTHGAWTKDGQRIYATDNVGSLDYTFTLPEAGVYRLGVAISEHSPYASSSKSYFDLRATVNGVSQGVRGAHAPHGQTTWVYYSLPHLPSGTHEILLDWVNSRLGTRLSVHGLKLERFDGPDSDQNGLADWIDHRIALTLQSDELPAETLVSPFNLEGNAYSPGHVTGVSHPLSSPELSESLGIVRGLFRRYYTNAPLDPDEPTRLVIDPENGLHLIEHDISWASFNLHDHPTFDLRRDDSLLLTATLPDQPPVAFDLELIDPNGVTDVYPIPAGGTLETEFDQTGVWTVRAVLPVDGEPDPQILETEITVHQASFSPAPFVILNHTRDWQPALSGPEIELEQDANVTLLEPNPAADPRGFTLSAHGEGGGILARLPGEGAILDSTRVDVVTNHSREQTSNQVVETFDDGSVLVEAYIRLSHIPDDLSVKIHVFKSGVTLDDGTVNRILTADDFDEFGRYRFFMIRSPDVNGGNCHRISLSQAGEVF